jgi:hypothetical protein
MLFTKKEPNIFRFTEIKKIQWNNNDETKAKNNRRLAESQDFSSNI